MEGTSLSVLSAELRRIGNMLENLETIKYRVGSGKPHAPWRPRHEFMKLLNEGSCTRCTKHGHMSRSCPSFRGPKRQNSQVSTVIVSGDEESKNEAP